jgi:hypothetical protein
MTYVRLRYRAEFFLEWEILQTKVVDKVKTHFMLNFFFRKLCRLWNHVENCGTAGQVTHDNTIGRRKDVRIQTYIHNT